MIDNRYKFTKTSKKVVKQWMSVLVLVTVLTYISQPVQVPLSPKGDHSLVTIAHAQEQAVEPTTQPTKQEILRYMVEKFGDDADKMISIVGRCENGTWDQSRTNKNSNGSTDYGIMQINDLNGKRDTQCEDYRHNWKANIDCGKKIFDSQGIGAWVCARTLGYIK